jgi:hypothetical protein
MLIDFRVMRRIAGITLLVAVSIAQSRFVFAEDAEPLAVSDQELETAFRLGSSPADETAGTFTLEVTRYGHTLKLQSSRSGEPSKDVAELVCTLCSKEEALSSARELGALTTCRTNGTIPARLFVEGELPGVRIAVDDVPLAPLKSGHSLVQGTHEITAMQGRKTKTSRVDVQEGKQVVLDLQSSTFAPKSKLRPALVLGGLGLTAGALGAVFLNFDGQCQAWAEAPSNQCREFYNFKAAGWAAIGTGIAVELGMVIWLLIANGEEGLSFKEK